MSPDNTHGVVYAPSPAQRGPIDVGNLKTKHNIRYIRVQWTEYTNKARFRVLPISTFEKVLQSNRPGVVVAHVVLGLVRLRPAPGFHGIGEYLFVIDLTSWRLCPYAPGHATITGWFQYKAPINNSLTVDLCPRTILSRITQRAKEKHGVEFLVGFEHEFCLLKSTNPIVPVHEADFSSSDGLLSGLTQTKVMEEIADAIQESDIELILYHTEAAPGQYEVATGPLSPLEAADAAVHTREIIYNVANKHGLKASFAPRLFTHSVGSSAHAHISVHSTSPDDGRKTKERLSVVEEQFLAGLMEHLPAVPAFTLPTVASYKRVGDGVWSGGTYVCWGTENREAPIRLVNRASPQSRRFEMRFLDCTASSYLGLAAILGAGISGVVRKTPLEVKDCSEVPAASMSDEQRREMGVSKRMPVSWKEGREKLMADKWITEEVFGGNLVDRYLGVNDVLNEELEKGEDEEAERRNVAEYY